MKKREINENIFIIFMILSAGITVFSAIALVWTACYTANMVRILHEGGYFDSFWTPEFSIITLTVSSVLFIASVVGIIVFSLKYKKHKRLNKSDNKRIDFAS